MVKKIFLTFIIVFQNNYSTLNYYQYCFKVSVSSALSFVTKNTKNFVLLKVILVGRSQDGGGVGQGEHFLPHKFIKRVNVE